MRFTFVVLLTLGCTTTTGSAPGGTPAGPPPGAFHTMKAGETVWDVARASGLSVDEIVEVNGLPSANDVAAGQVLFLPAGGGAPVVDAAPPERVEAPAAVKPATLRWPVAGVVLRDFGVGRNAFDGLLIAAPADTSVTAAADGEVAFAGDQGTAYGVVVILKHGGDLVTIYGHLARADVKAGDKVAAGAPLGVVGTTGGAESPRLHFEVRQGKTAVDPLPLLP